MLINDQFIYKHGIQGNIFVRIGQNQKGPYKRIIGCPMELNDQILVNAIMPDDTLKFLVIEVTKLNAIINPQKSASLDDLVVEKTEHEFYSEVTNPIESNGKIIYGARQGDTWILVAKT